MPWNLYKANCAAETYMKDNYGLDLKAKYSYSPIIENIGYNVKFESEEGFDFWVYITVSNFTYEGTNYVKEYAENYMEKKYGSDISSIIEGENKVSFSTEQYPDPEEYHSYGNDIDESKLVNLEYNVWVYFDDELKDDGIVEDIVKAIENIENNKLNIYELIIRTPEKSYHLNNISQYKDPDLLKKELNLID